MNSKRFSWSVHSLVGVFLLAGHAGMPGRVTAQVTLDTYSAPRLAGDGSPLWQAQNDISAGSDTSCTVTGGFLNCSALPMQPGETVINGIGYWLYTITGNNYENPNSYLNHYILSGTWSSGLNRMRTRYYCDAAVPGATSGRHNIEIGTYTRSQQDPNAPQSGQGQHYYHFADPNVFPNRWVYMELNRVVDHRVQNFGSANYVEDPEWLTSLSIYPSHYYDGMTHFYWSGAEIVSGTTVNTYNTTCHFDYWTLDTVAKGADNWVHSIGATYNGSAYEISWQAPKNIPGGITYSARSSASSMRSNGWSTGASMPSLVSGDATPYGSVLYTSPAMAENKNGMYFAFRPQMKILSVSNTNPILVTPYVDHNIASGDQVTVAGIGGLTAANGTWTLTDVPTKSFRIADGTLTSITMSGGVATVTTRNPHTLLAGQAMIITMSPNGDLDNYASPIIIRSVPTPNTLTYTAPSGVTGPYNSTNSGSMLLYSLDALSLNGSNGVTSGTYTPGTGTATATSDKDNFAEVYVPYTLITSPCDLNNDGVVDQNDFQLAGNAAIGAAPCTADLDANGACNSTDVQRVAVAATGGACRVGQ